VCDGPGFGFDATDSDTDTDTDSGTDSDTDTDIDGSAPEWIKGPGGLTMEESEAYCVGIGGHLISIHSSEEHDAAIAFCSGVCWIGLNKFGPVSDDSVHGWQWTDGSALDYGFDNSGTGNPVGPHVWPWYDGVGASCVLQVGGPDLGAWDDRQCVDRYHPLCSVPLPTPTPPAPTTTTVLAASGVCMHSTKFTKGYSFTAPYAGKVIGVELSNPIGGTTCNEDEYDQKYWGGCVSDRMRFSLIREDAEEGNEVMYPTQTTEGLSLYDDWDCPVGGCSVNTWTISGFSYDSEFLSLKDTEHPHEVSVDDVFSLQISEGCCDYTTSDNEGTTCADVHFVYESIDGEYHGDSDLVLSRPVVSHGNLNNKNTPCSGDDCLGECEGECDRDDHCQHGLVCWHRTGWDSNVPPGCSGSAHDEHHDYCYDPNRRIPVEDKGVNQPSDDCGCLLECEGDCDSDADCHGNLVCWHRDGWDDLVPPGCRGDVHGRLYDYCYDPNNHDSNAREISVSSGNAAATHSVHSEDAGESVDDFVAIALGAAVGMAMVGVVVAVIVVMRRRKGMEKEEEVAMSEVVTAPKVQPTESMDGVEAISESVTVPKEQPAESIDGVETV